MPALQTLGGPPPVPSFPGRRPMAPPQSPALPGAVNPMAVAPFAPQGNFAMAGKVRPPKKPPLPGQAPGVPPLPGLGDAMPPGTPGLGGPSATMMAGQNIFR